MTDKKQISRSEMRKLLIKQQLQEQRQELKLQTQPLLKTGQRVIGLFTPNNNQQHSSGKAARYIIINYPGLLHKLIK